MEINIPQPIKPDIFSLGFDRTLNRPLLSSMDFGDESRVESRQVASGGNLTLKSLSIGGFVKQVAPGDDIQAAIDAVNREGGGIVQLLSATYLLTSGIEGRSKVALIGAGRDQTILDFEGRAFGLSVIGSTTNPITNFLLKDFTIQNSNAVAGISIDYGNFWKTENVRIFSCNQIGIRVRYSENYTVYNVRSDNNTGNGIETFGVNGGGGSGQSDIYTWDLCESDNNGEDGFYNDNGSNDLVPFGAFRNCYAGNNTGNGFSIVGTSSESYLCCFSKLNGGYGYHQKIGSGNTKQYIASSSAQNSGGGFFITTGAASLIACDSLGDSNFGIKTTTTGSVYSSGCSDPHDLSGAEDTRINIYGIRPLPDNVSGGDTDGPHNNYRFYSMKNTSGASIPAGAVVVLKSVAAGNEITTTTTNGDNKVFGMASVAITNNRPAGIMVQGTTTAKLLVANGTTSIVIGDWLSTYSHAYYAKKAITGDMVFAMALSTPTTGTAAINALLVNPRLI